MGSRVNECAEMWKSNVPAEGQDCRKERDGDSGYHVTIITAAEMSEYKLSRSIIDDAAMEVTLQEVGYAVVEKGSQKSWYVVVYCAWADNLRKNLLLPQRDYHITLGFLGGDLHGASCLYHCIGEWSRDVEAMVSLANNIVHGSARNHREVMIIRTTSNALMCTPHASAAQLRDLRGIVTWCLVDSTHLLDLINDIGHYMLLQGLAYGLKLIIHCRNDVCSTHNIDYLLPQALSSSAVIEKQRQLVRESNLLIQCRTKMQHELGKAPKWCYKDRVLAIHAEHNAVELLQLPRNFSWVTLQGFDLNEPSCSPQLQFLLAGSAIPSAVSQVAALSGVGIRRIITVHEESLSATLCPTVPVNPALTLDSTRMGAKSGGILAHHFAVVDRFPPDLEQLKVMCQIIHESVSRQEGVLVHCQGGVGRTNTVIIAYLMWAKNLSAADATERVTAQRKIILSQPQKHCLQRWWTYCNETRSSRLSEASSLPHVTVEASEGSCALKKTKSVLQMVPMYRKVASTLDLPPLIVLCGFAASGKSTFAKALIAASPYFVRVNKDEMRGKNQCEDTLFDALNAMKRSGRKGATDTTGAYAEAGTVVIDNCNLATAKRKEWVELAHSPRAWCIYFDVSLEKCKTRIQQRTGHPTIHSGVAGMRILDSMAKMLQPPSLATAKKEGFERLIVLQDEQQVADLLAQWKIPFDVGTVGAAAAHAASESSDEGETSAAAGHTDGDDLLKFPRTAHIANLGAATRDDKVLGHGDLAALVGPQHHIIVEEKVDGANMGIFISKEENKIMVQNRSHFISSKYHPQFAPLDHWLAQHTGDLWTILTPGRHILYGEWLHATHSVKYTNLPGWFVAYDLYDRVTKKFASREVLAALLATTSIPHVPLVFEGSVNNLEDLKSMVEGRSRYNDARREGVVVRICDGERLVSRAKLVRPDFIAGNERWNKSSKLETNSLASFEK